MIGSGTYPSHTESGSILEGRIPPEGKKKKKRGKGRGRDEDRYFGKFSCGNCKKTWESAHVYTFGGTMHVKYKQRCKNCNCESAWVFPYDLQMIQCSVCGEPSKFCQCLCEDCHRLWYRPRGKTQDLNEDDYCKCDRRNSRKNRLGEKIDAKKPHERALCQRCSTGRPCWGQSIWDEADNLATNEP